MTDRQPYIDALSRALPGGGWIACSLDPLRIRSQAFEEICILFPTDGRCPHMTLTRYPYHLPVEPEALAVEARRAVGRRLERMAEATKILRAMCFPVGG